MKRLILVFLILGLLAGRVYGADEWSKDEPLGTRNVSDLDYYLGINNEAVDRMTANYRKGAKITYASASTITVGIGEIMCSNAAGTLRKMRKNTAATTVAWTDIDTGAEANSTDYYLYSICDTDAETFTVIISANSSTPQGGQTYYKRLGSFYNDGSGDILNDETIVNDDDYYGLQLGDWVSKTIGTSYLASTDGFVTAFIDLPSSGGSAGGIIGYTDASNPPTTARAKGYVTQNLEDSSVSFPVKKGDYYKVSQSGGSGSSTGMYFIPNE